MRDKDSPHIFTVFSSAKALSRRAFLQKSGLVMQLIAISSLLPSCVRRQYIRSAQKCRLGPPLTFFFPFQIATEHAIAVKRRDKGWSAMDARCTYEGCDLSFDGKSLFCPCCKSIYSLEGSVLSPPAETPLKHWRMSYESGHLIAFAGDSVERDQFFSLPELEEEMAPLVEKYAKEGLVAITKPDPELTDPNNLINQPRFRTEEEEEQLKMAPVYETLKKDQRKHGKK